MSIELKIKAMSLGAEARIIRAQEQRLKRRRAKGKSRALGKPRHVNEPVDLAFLWRYDWNLNEIHFHRVGPVRTEARLTHLTRAYSAGQAYEVVEATTKPEKALTQQDLERIRDMANKYVKKAWADKATLEDVIAWVGPGRLGDWINHYSSALAKAS